MLGGAVGLPYIASRLPGAGDAAVTQPAASAPPAAAASATTPAEPVKTELSPPQSPGALVYANPAPVEGARFHSVGQVFRFDLTKEWVYRNWARKFTGPTDVGLFSVRVPLVTGTHVSSLAGSLTYYFNAYGQIEHISFRGRTGDTTELVSLLVRTYEFQRVDGPINEQIYQVKRGGRVQSEFRSRPEPVLWSTSPHGSFAVELELARPGSKRVLPPRGTGLEILQVAGDTPASAESADANSTDASGDSYLDKLRYATPQEEGQVLWKRWPN
jgi:hypothetical protein